MIHGAVYTALMNLAGGRVYPSNFPQPKPPAAPVWPAIRYQVVSQEPIVDICGTDLGATDEITVRVDVVAKTHGAALTLRDQVRAAMASITPVCVRSSGFETFDSETVTHRMADDYLFSWSSEES